MTAWIVRTGIVVSRLLTNSGASLSGAWPPFEILLERAAHGGVQGHFTRLETLAVADAHAAGAVVHGDVGNLQRGDFTDAQSGLKHELRDRVVPRREAMGGGAGRAKQRVDLDVGQAGRLAVAHRAHGPDVARGIGSQDAGPARPSAQPAQGVQPAIDRGGPPTGGDHVLAVGDQFVFGEPLDGEGAVLHRAVPGEEVAQIVAVTAQGGRREVVARQAGEEGRHPSRLARGIDCRCLYCTQSQPPR